MALDIKKFLQRFIEEARDHLSRLAEGVAALEQGQRDPEQIHGLFRSAHTLKGSSRMLKLEPITVLSHSLEDLLSILREGQLQLTPAVTGLMYQALDQLSDQVERLAGTLDAASLAEVDAALCKALVKPRIHRHRQRIRQKRPLRRRRKLLPPRLHPACKPRIPCVFGYTNWMN